MTSRPRKPNELDGPEEVHPALSAGQRPQPGFADSESAPDPQLHPLWCLYESIAVYTRIGGHAYGEVPRPDRKKSSRRIWSAWRKSGPPQSVFVCGAWREVRPVKIPIPARCAVCGKRNVKAPDSPHPLCAAGQQVFAPEVHLERLGQAPQLTGRYTACSWLAATRLRALVPSNVQPDAKP